MAGNTCVWFSEAVRFLSVRSLTDLSVRGLNLIFLKYLQILLANTKH